MIEVSVNEAARSLEKLLQQVKEGTAVHIRSASGAGATLVAEPGFMSGNEFARCFDGYQATPEDQAAAREIAAQIARLDEEQSHALAH